MPIVGERRVQAACITAEKSAIRVLVVDEDPGSYAAVW